MTSTTRIIHRDDPAAVKAAAMSPRNPMASVLETARVWVNENGVLVPFTDWATFVATVRTTKLIFNTDLLSAKHEKADRAAMLADLAKRLNAEGIDPATVAFITDWEEWATNPPNAKAEFAWWYSIMQAWPGEIGNYGNCEGKHVAEFLRWPWLRNIPSSRGVSCPSAYNLGMKPDAVASTIAVCRSIRPPSPPKRRRIVVFICDAAYHELEGTKQADYIKSAGDHADKVMWAISKTYDAAKFPNFKAKDRLAQDAITARNLKIVRGG